MKLEIIRLPKGKYISQIEPFKSSGLKTNTIYHKTEPGCGFTSFAIRELKSNLLLMEPNVPVIESKVIEHNKKFTSSKILGVYKGVEVSDIKAYLLSNVQYKKILSTPEGFHKIKEALSDKALGFNMYRDFFMLYDECERIISDVNYRGDIAAPIDDFFEFNNKAMVSATTLPYTDERFQDFSHYIIEPTYDYSKPITVIETDNVLQALKEHLTELNSNLLCVFFNSTKGIKAAIKHLDIVRESKVFCANNSVVELLKAGFTEATFHLEVNEMRKYNFFTSRYFSAVDIVLESKPDVIMLSDVIFAPHSILDPYTEIIQIPGRFRNGVNSITHLSNFNNEICAMSKDEALFFLKGSLTTYDGFVKDYESATHPGSKKALKKAIESSDEHRFYSNGRLNTFMVDNFIHEERVKGYYHSFDKLKVAYHEQIKHFTVNHIVKKYYVSDTDIKKLYYVTSAKEERRIIVELFDRWTSTIDNYTFAPDELLSAFITKHSDLWNAFLLLGKLKLDSTGYELTKIKSLVKQAEKEKQYCELAPKVYEHFKESAKYADSYIIQVLKIIYKEANINKNVTASLILKFFNGYRSTEKGEHIHVLREKTHPVTNPNN